MESWFGAGLRTRMAVGVEEIVRSGVGGRRKCFYDESGNDLRLKVPGVLWESVTKLRKDVLENVRGNVQEAFDKIYDQITNDRRASINRHVLPTIKTPCARKTRSRVQPQPQSSNSPPSTSSPPHPPPPLTTLNSSLMTAFTPRSVARMKPAEHDNDSDKTFPTNPQSLLQEVMQSQDKENVKDVAVSTAPSPKKGRGRLRRNATRVDVLVVAEEETTIGRRVTRSSIRGGGVESSPPTTRKTTRSRAGKAGRKAKPQVLQAIEVVDVESNETDSVCNEKNDPGKMQSSPPRVRRSTRNTGRSVKYHDASPPHVASPLLQCQRKPTRTALASPPTKTKDHRQAPPSSSTQQAPPSNIPTTHSTTTDFAQPSSSSEIVNSHYATPPCEITTTNNKTKTDTPHPASFTESPSTSASAHSAESLPKSQSTVDRMMECLTPSLGDVTALQQALCLTPSASKRADGTLCNSRSPPGQWFTSMPTVVKQPTSKSSATSTRPSPLHQLEIDARVDEAAPNEIGNIPEVSHNSTHSLPEVIVEQRRTRALCGTVTKTRSCVSESRDSGISSERSNEGEEEAREHRSDSVALGVAGGKRLRSVSMEKISLSEVEAKRVSLICSAAKSRSSDSPGATVQDEESANEEEAMVIGDGSESDENSSPNTKSSGDTSADYPITMNTSPTGSDGVQVSSDEAMEAGSSPESTSSSSSSSEATSSGGTGTGDQQKRRMQRERYDSLTCGEDGSSQEDASSSPGERDGGGEGGRRSTDEGESQEDSPGDKAVTIPTVLPTLTSAALASAESDLRRSPAVSFTKTRASPWAFLSHKTHFHDVPLKNALQLMESRPATFLSPKASPKRPEGAGMTVNGTTLPHSFLAKGSPQQILKAETKAARQRKLMEHLQRKKDEEEQRKRELEEKKLQEVENRKKRNAERALKAAEKRRQEEEKKLHQRKKAQEHVHEHQSKQQLRLYQLKADERKEKSKKHNERVAAVLARKRQEEEMKAKKLQQIEEDHRMAQELFKQRQEREEEERQMKRAEKQERDRERQMREAEDKERQLNNSDDKSQPEGVSKANKPKPTIPENPKKQDFKELLASTCAINITTNAARLLSDWKLTNKAPAATATVTKPCPTLPVPSAPVVTLSDCPPPQPNDNDSASTSQPSDLNSTFTIDASSTADHQTTSPAVVTTKDILVTPNKPMNTNERNSYKMTPANQHFSNYGIDDLSSGDETDEEERPKKPIPSWAKTEQLRPLVSVQEGRVISGLLNPSLIFPPVELMQEVDLARIFRLKKKRFYHRSSSANWDSPPTLPSKRGKFDGFSARLV